MRLTDRLLLQCGCCTDVLCDMKERGGEAVNLQVDL